MLSNFDSDACLYTDLRQGLPAPGPPRGEHACRWRSVGDQSQPTAHQLGKADASGGPSQ
ncbi:MAG: hypothetical protein WCA39_04815 [Nitrososphaeraceae archaeon]